MDGLGHHNGRSERCAIAIMAKAPGAGRIKTRLPPLLSPQEANALAMSSYCAARFRHVADDVNPITRTAGVAAGTARAGAAPRLEWMVPGRTSKAKRLQAPPALALKFWSQCELNGDGRARRPG